MNSYSTPTSSLIQYSMGVGLSVGPSVGDAVGLSVGESVVGARVGDAVGSGVGLDVGGSVGGRGVGRSVGLNVGCAVGRGVGRSVGTGVSQEQSTFAPQTSIKEPSSLSQNSGGSSPSTCVSLKLNSTKLVKEASSDGMVPVICVLLSIHKRSRPAGMDSSCKKRPDLLAGVERPVMEASSDGIGPDSY